MVCLFKSQQEMTVFSNQSPPQYPPQLDLQGCIWEVGCGDIACWLSRLGQVHCLCVFHVFSMCFSCVFHVFFGRFPCVSYACRWPSGRKRHGAALKPGPERWYGESCGAFDHQCFIMNVLFWLPLLGKLYHKVRFGTHNRTVLIKVCVTESIVEGGAQVKIMNFALNNEILCITNKEFCIKNKEFCIKNKRFLY